MKIILKNLMTLMDPAQQGNPYVRDEVGQKTVQKKPLHLFLKRRLVLR